LHQKRGAAPPRVGRCASPLDNTDAAEIVVPLGPAPDAQARGLEPRKRVSVDAGLGIDDATSQVHARPVDATAASAADPPAARTSTPASAVAE